MVNNNLLTITSDNGHEYDVLLLNETWWLDKGELVYFKKINAHHCTRGDGYRGVSIYTKNNLICKWNFRSETDRGNWGGNCKHTKKKWRLFCSTSHPAWTTMNSQVKIRKTHQQMRTSFERNNSRRYKCSLYVMKQRHKNWL